MVDDPVEVAVELRPQRTRGSPRIEGNPPAVISSTESRSVSGDLPRTGCRPPVARARRDTDGSATPRSTSVSGRMRMATIRPASLQRGLGLPDPLRAVEEDRRDVREQLVQLVVDD